MAELETPGNESDPIERLHKMSTTAGVGSQEYVAVNNFAVFAAVLGVASGLAILALPLLVVPTAAVIFGVWSLVQIGRSNGTQGGRLLASLGILFAIGISGTVLFGNWRQKVMYRDQEVRVNAVIAQLGNVLREDKISEAYAFFDDVYRQKVSERVFADRWKAIVDTPSVGPLVSLAGNNRFRWASPRSVYTRFVGRFENMQSEASDDIQLVRGPDDRWLVRDFGFVRVPPENAQPGGDGQGVDGVPAGPPVP